MGGSQTKKDLPPSDDNVIYERALSANPFIYNQRMHPPAERKSVHPTPAERKSVHPTTGGDHPQPEPDKQRFSEDSSSAPVHDVNRNSKDNMPRRSSVLPSSAMAGRHQRGSGLGSKCKHRLASIFSPIWEYCKRLFTIPLVHDPISYSRADDFTAAGDRIYDMNHDESEETLDMIEAACNYSQKTGAIFDLILQERKNSAMSRNWVNLDFSRFAPWNEAMLDRLQCMFQIFDESGDGQVDLEEMSNMMIDFGDKSTDEDRRKVFNEADVEGRGRLSFQQFVAMLHTIMVKSPDTCPQSIVETFHQIDRNMQRIRGLDVVQQLQAGLF